MENANLTEARKQLIELDRRKSGEIKEFYKEYDAALKAVLEEDGYESKFQDDEGVVYELEKPSGTFVSFPEARVSRTRRLSQEEKKGSMSLKAAREAGFEVE